jgi:hypothetical protein
MKTGNNGTVVEQLTYNPKFEGSNPATVDTWPNRVCPWQGATTLSITTLSITTLSLMTFSENSIKLRNDD